MRTITSFCLPFLYSFAGYVVALNLNAGEKESIDITTCFEPKSGMRIAKVDENNHRIFAIPRDRSEQTIVGQVRSSAACFNNSGWAKDWSVSVFSKEKYAGYKDEQHIVPYHKNNEWAKAYLGEFDGASQSYTSFAAMNP